MGIFRQGCIRVLCCAAIAVYGQTGLGAAPQDPGDPPAPSLSRIKQRLNKPAATRLAPKEPVQLRPTFRTHVTGRPWVPTLEEHLRETFTLTDFQRQYAAYAGRCCGLDLGALVGTIDRALAERRERKIREEVARELAFVEASRPPVKDDR
ncbi:MAG TPA: hypothetical protein VFK57_00415 [Vicinamibacterales bacterium]|nr:hypothetical protein [Vicinamibacterales bacterium]